MTAKYVVNVKNDDKYEITLKEMKKQMKDFLDEGDKVVYIRSDDNNVYVIYEAK